MALIKKFANGITASVILLGKERNLLEINEQGIIVIPEGIIPRAFRLSLRAEEKRRIVFAQKNIEQENGAYHSFSPKDELIALTTEELVGHKTFPIQVIRTEDGKVWTAWHQKETNRMDCWLLKKNGWLGLFQVGIITHDNGKTFRLLGEWRWSGTLFLQPDGKFVGKPENPVWGTMSPNGTRDEIFQHPEMQKLISQSQIEPWNGSPEELNPALSPVPKGKFARVDWYISFAGQNGQGIVILPNGTNAWVHGEQILDPPDADGIKRVRRNNLLQYADIVPNWGSKPRPPKLVGVRRV